MSDKFLAFYIRLSVEDGDRAKAAGRQESNSITHQRDLLQDYYSRHPELHAYQVLEFCDDGYSGTNFQRPGFQRMMDLIKNQRLHGIMVKDLSRFGREYLEVGAYLELILPLYGTRFISVNDGFDSNDFLGTTGGMELALRNLINGMYSRDLSVKVRSAIQSRNRQGKYWGGQAFYGYQLDPTDKHRLVVDEAVQDTVALIFQLCLDGMSTMQIARHLNDLGIPSPAQYKKNQGIAYNGRVMQDNTAWIGSTVRKILQDERYTGKMVSGTRERDGIRTTKTRQLPREQWIVVENTHAPIISEETFQAAQAALRSRLRTVNRNTAGNRNHNFFVCGYCGRRLQKSSGTEQYLYCVQPRSSHCPDCASIHEDLETVRQNTLSVVQRHATLLLDQTIFQKDLIAAKQKHCSNEILRAESRLHSIVLGKRALYEAYRDGRYSAAGYKQLQQKNAAEADKLEAKIRALKDAALAQQTQQEVLAQAEASSRQFAALDTFRPEVLCRLIDRVRVFSGGRLELIFKSQDVFDNVLKDADSIRCMK